MMNSILGNRCGTGVALLLAFALASPVAAQTLEDQLKSEPASQLAIQAKQEGDAVRGAIVFHQQQMACSKCHSVSGAATSLLGPDLARPDTDVTAETIIESVLTPSKLIRKGFESVTVVTTEGKTVSGIVVERAPEKLVLRDASRLGELVTLTKADIDEVKDNPLSLMPAGQVNQLASRQQFLDLIRYLIEIREQGPARAKELQPSPALLTFTIPEYEQHLDHAGLIQSWNGESLKRGEAIYQRVCANCHGTKDRPGSLPNSLRFAEGKFKNGSEPLAMYQTMTRGFGLMAPQTWMVPSQKYDVIHYIRETYLQPHNPSQFVAVDANYLARLPKGDTRGPEPSLIEPWSAMDYGPQLTHTYEVPGTAKNLAYKGMAIRLDPGAGGVSRGRHWMIFDTDTLRMAAQWSAGSSGEKFIDWRGIQFDGEHQIHPHIIGSVTVSNSTGPGWADPSSGSFADERRVEGRDGLRYGPLPRDWAKYRGMYYHGQNVIVSYSVGKTEVLEMPRLEAAEEPGRPPLFLRTFQIGPRERDLVLKVAEQPAPNFEMVSFDKDHASSVAFQPATAEAATSATSDKIAKFVFDGQTYLDIPQGDAFDLTSKDFTIQARLKTNQGGTIFSLAQPGPKWTPDGQTFFIRDGRLGFDIGWVGAVTSQAKINDGQWHNVAVTWQLSDQKLSLFIDGKLDGQGTLAAKAKLPSAVVRIGFTAPDFPQPESFFQGELAEVRFSQRRLTQGLGDLTAAPLEDKTLIGRWELTAATGTEVSDLSGQKHHAEVRHGEAAPSVAAHPILAGIAPQSTSVRWSTADGRLCLTIPAGREALRFTVWTSDAPANLTAAALANPVIADAALDLASLTHGGPARWPQILETAAITGSDDGPFAVDVLTPPDSNPWLAQLRFTGLDFLPDGKLAVCTWDGDVWLVESVPDSSKLHWQRIATGLFQPLGLKVVHGKIHLTCRDQLVVLHDLNGDCEIDYYECLNNDHQVTEHFHEFAMGLQTDEQGNFYYAKSGRHALKAIVPHHGTLLRVSKDGSKTEILATGFRAANGVCLNPDGSFVVTDQEGFWNPKNRINWVTLDPSGKPNFYGNMFGYTDVTDSSDSAMVPPLCWITNEFDRSPAELLWVKSPKWGALNGSLLNLSYGTGKVFLVPHEKSGSNMQGGMIQLPIPAFPTGVMRGRFHPSDGQLYLCGMFAWAGSATQPGGLYRLRATNEPAYLPIGLHATKTGLKLTFTDPLDPTKLDPKQMRIKTWSLKRTANYGSKHYDEKTLPVQGATLSGDRQTLTLQVADLQPTWGMEIKYTLRFADGATASGVIHNTIHSLTE